MRITPGAGDTHHLRNVPLVGVAPVACDCFAARFEPDLRVTLNSRNMLSGAFLVLVWIALREYGTESDY